MFYNKTPFSEGTQYYENNINNQYNINLGTTGRIKLELFIDLEEDYDYVQVYETNESFELITPVRYYSGYHGNVEYLSYTPNGKLIVLFYTDESVSGSDGYEGMSFSCSLCTDPINTISENDPVLIGAHSDGPNFTINDAIYKTMGTSPVSSTDYSKSMILLENGSYYKMGISSDRISANSTLSLTSSSNMYFNSSGNYYFTSPSSSYPYPFKIYNTGKIGLNNPSNMNSYINVKVVGIQWEGFLKFAPTTSGYAMSLGNGGNAIGSGFMPTLTGTTKDNISALYLYADFNGTTPGSSGIMTFDSRFSGGAAAEDIVVFEYCTGYGNRIAHITGDGSFYVKGDIEAKGTIKANEVIVQDMTASNITVAANGNTADFVFADDYSLKNLDEVEAFIKANKHLPEIPSAQAMENSGVNLAKMNQLLLQKIEELTLYIIEQNKRIELLEKENKNLKK